MNNVCLVILDGYGINEVVSPKESEIETGSLITSQKVTPPKIEPILHPTVNDFDAVALGTAPAFRRLFKKYPYTLLYASGEHVGLPKGQMGNSEVGHLNIGAGKVVCQDLMRINKSIEDKSFYKNDALTKAITTNGRLHLIGLCSEGGVHSSFNHLVELIKLCAYHNFGNVFIHFISDGRDTNVNDGIYYATKLNEIIDELFKGQQKKPIIASLSGRYYAMDREKNNDRTSLYFNAIANNFCDTNQKDVISALKYNYKSGITDEFIKPTLFTNSEFKENDSVIFYNFRADRMRQIVSLTLELAKKINLNVITFTQYDESFSSVKIAFPPQKEKDTLSEIVSRAGLTQLKVAEFTKYAHVTYFLNGGEEQPFKNEDRKLIDMVNVSTFDKAPKMSACKVYNEVIKGMKNGYNLIVVNFANCDMVGHTGKFKPACIAVKEVTNLATKIAHFGLKSGYAVAITADHGNAEIMKQDGKPCTTHTTNRVPFLLVSNEHLNLKNGASLSAISPTILDLMNISKQ